MLNKVKIYTIFVIIAMVLLCLYTYLSMLWLGFGQSVGSFTSIVHLLFVILGMVAILLATKEAQTRFTMLWLIWSVWLVVDFFILGMQRGSLNNIVHVLFVPMAFLLFYNASLFSAKVERIAYLGGVILFGIAFYMNLHNLSYRGIILTEEMGRSNLVYWCLCAVPFLLLSNKQWLRLSFVVLSIIVVLVTGKRSAFIAIMVIGVVYMFNTIKGNKQSYKNIVLFVFVGLAVYLIFYKYLSNSAMTHFERLSNMQEDQGSGRITIYKDVFAIMRHNTFNDWFVGRGFGSITISRHSNAHNDALQLLFEFGIIGLIMYVTMFIHIIKRTVVLRKVQSSYYLSYVASVIITIILGAVSNLVVFYSYFAFICAYWGIVEAEMVNNSLIRKFHFDFN